MGVPLKEYRFTPEELGERVIFPFSPLKSKVNRVHKSADPSWFINQIRPSIFALNPKSGQKYFNEAFQGVNDQYCVYQQEHLQS